MQRIEAHQNGWSRWIAQWQTPSRRPHLCLYGLVLATSLVAPGAALALDIGDKAPGYAEACRKITETEIIDGAIEWFVDIGNYYNRHRGNPGLSEVNPYPYSTVAEFKAKNPDCCQILPQIPGDFPAATQKLGKENAGYRSLFAVKMAFLENTRTGLKKRYDTLLINCFGQRPKGA